MSAPLAVEVPPTRLYRSEIVEAHRDIRQAEAHFNQLQSQYRLLASTWMLAALAGIGFVLSRPLELALPKPLVAAFISLIAAVGTILLWIIDMRVYQRLLGANFQEGLAMEKAFPWLPQVRFNMRERFRYRLPMMIGAYYVAQSAALWSLACILYFSDTSGETFSVSPMAVASIAPGTLLIAMLIFWFAWPSRREAQATWEDERAAELRRADLCDDTEFKST